MTEFEKLVIRLLVRIFYYLATDNYNRRLREDEMALVQQAKNMITGRL